MKVLKDAVKEAFVKGTGQIPQFDIIKEESSKMVMVGAEDLPDSVEIPDEWVVFMHSSCRRYAVSKREKSHAYLFLSRKGFDDNKDKYSNLKGFYDMEKKLKETWDKMDKGTKQYMKKLQNKLQGGY